MTDNNGMIDIRGLTKTFMVEGRPHTVLQDLNLTVPAHEITVLLGRSGCGKTTLLRLIGGLDTEYSGTISTPENAKTAFVLGLKYFSSSSAGKS